ncbi:MAG: hypothetical protein KKF46_07105 [Nanoarchaeota archaeon]|nr:hypothetical protein [Nanoarchaeota archaeon]MBU1322096.1 hypothetical protein [Nanoarchaeota archaeon]MBU1597914.1 hypothetical protein [Nanoarchaeota archaeon]MBU2442060.1 hypothetical protein [Nanoarchaeota archaeon]
MYLFNKKAKTMLANLFYVMFGLILAAFFVIAVFLRVESALGDSTFHKRFYARDLALLVDSMHASNGYFVMEYDVNTPDNMPLDINLEPDHVFLTDRDDKPVESRAKTLFRIGFNEYVSVNKSNITVTPSSFKIIFENNSIRFD